MPRYMLLMHPAAVPDVGDVPPPELVADLVGEAPVRESMESLRRDIIDLQARLDIAEANAGTLPHRQKYLLLNIGFMRRLFALQLEWIDEVERELAPKARGRRTG